MIAPDWDALAAAYPSVGVALAKANQSARRVSELEKELEDARNALTRAHAESLSLAKYYTETHGK